MLAQRGLTLDDLGEILKIIYGGICALMTRTALRKKRQAHSVTLPPVLSHPCSLSSAF